MGGGGFTFSFVHSPPPVCHLPTPPCPYSSVPCHPASFPPPHLPPSTPPSGFLCTSFCGYILQHVCSPSFFHTSASGVLGFTSYLPSTACFAISITCIPHLLPTHLSHLHTIYLAPMPGGVMPLMHTYTSPFRTHRASYLSHCASTPTRAAPHLHIACATGTLNVCHCLSSVSCYHSSVSYPLIFCQLLAYLSALLSSSLLVLIMSLIIIYAFFFSPVAAYHSRCACL